MLNMSKVARKSRSKVGPRHGPFNVKRGKTVKKEETTTTFKSAKWDNIKCPVCLDAPHKAIRLNCSEGCLPYVCDTDYIMSSHCFNKLCDSQSVERPPKRTPAGERPTRFEFSVDRRRPSCPVDGCRGEVTGWVVKKRAREAMDAIVRTCKKTGWMVDKRERKSVDAIVGRCSKSGYCGVNGNYAELKDHARILHDRSNYDFYHDHDDFLM